MKKKSTTKRKKKQNRSTFTIVGLRILKFIAGVAFAAITCFIIFVFLVSIGLFGSIPNKEELSNIKNNHATQIYSADNKVIGRYFLQQRTPTGYKNISPNVIHALVATEDARFYDHSGIDYRSWVRVFFKTLLLQDRSGGGGSTISQQLAKNLYPREKYSIFYLTTRKIKEILIAKRLESTYSKDEIITLYLNTVPFGEDIYGIEMASKRFFNKSTNDLAPEEAAVLVGMLKANHTYNPRLFPENAKFRRDVVLGQMYKYDYLSEDSLKLLKELPLAINYSKISSTEGPATYFREQLRKKITAWCEDNKKEDGTHYNMYTDGLKVYTTIDSRIQSYAEVAMKKHMTALQKSFEKHWGNQDPWYTNKSILENAIKQSPRYKGLKKKGLTEDEIKAEMNKTYPMEIFSWDGDKEVKMSPNDSIKHYLKFLQAGAVAIDPNTGAVKAWVGGINHKYFKYDHAKESTKRQVGSTFKPFVYAAALEKGMDPCEFVSARKTTYSNLEGWSPDNADTSENELKYSYEGALAQSVNTVSVKVLEDAGIGNTIALAKRAGVNSDLPNVPSLALGTADISLIEMATAYSAFANNGQLVMPHFITKIEDMAGNVLYEAPEIEKEYVMSAETAMMMNELLKSVVNKGTAGRMRWKYGLKNDIAGKTGTTQSNADGWFIGYNPNLVMAVWVGADDPGIRFRSTALGSGANMALPIFAETFTQINNDPDLKSISNARFGTLPRNLQSKLNCGISKEDRNFFERLLNKDLTKKEKTRKFDADEKEKKKKGLFKKIGDLFKKKDDN